MTKNTYFYKDKPIFGLDIGFSSAKVMQLEKTGEKYAVTGYGVAGFDPSIIENGEIINCQPIAESIYNLFKKGLVGEITTRRVVFSVPSARTFTRILSLPKLAEKDMLEAVKLEAEQYIPIPLDELYIDYMPTFKTEKNIHVLVVAVPKKIIDSYVTLAKILDLEPVVMEPTTGATSRVFQYNDNSNVPTVLIDFGSVSSDITIFDKTLAVTGTVPGGGDDITEHIKNKLKVTKDEAQVIKVKYGISKSKKQKEITEAISPMLEQLIKEVKRMIRYYEERSAEHRKIEQVVTFGGGANIPGLSEYLIDNLRMPVRACDPWNNIKFKKLQPPNEIESSMYITVAGLALMEPREIFK